MNLSFCFRWNEREIGRDNGRERGWEKMKRRRYGDRKKQTHIYIYIYIVMEEKTESDGESERM